MTKCALPECEESTQKNQMTCSMKHANKYNRYLASKFDVKRKCECKNCGWFPAISVQPDYVEVYFCCGMKHLQKCKTDNPLKEKRLNTPKRLFRDDVDFGLNLLFSEVC
uniref:Putative PTGS supressor n=1 Tax=Pepper ringspot virus TaxID=31750 RepID=A0A060N117_9VIRU|nr:putative PTGS supressor [Pepper ringspot virus]BAN57349.1 putative PTGS supressor [Pepper ringspot virus]